MNIKILMGMSSYFLSTLPKYGGKSWQGIQKSGRVDKNHVLGLWHLATKNIRRLAITALMSSKQKREGSLLNSLFVFSEPLVGFEPTTPRLQITCSGQLS